MLSKEIFDFTEKLASRKKTYNGIKKYFIWAKAGKHSESAKKIWFDRKNTKQEK